MKKISVFSILLVFLTVGLNAQESELHIITTGDVHGSYFNRPYVGAKTKTSLMSVKHFVDSVRAAVGPENVLLLDAGDCLQGDNAAYYFNYVVPDQPHIYPRLVSYMGYDACVVGNHDIETGHAVYDKVFKELDGLGIPWLAGNAITPDGGTYFPEYKMIMKGGRKILVLGYNNANIAGWLSPELWSGMEHVSLVPLVRKRVRALRAKLHPDAVVVVVHSGTGSGDGKSIESQGLDIFRTLCGADVLVAAHDHRPAVVVTKKRCLIDGGARCGNVGHAVLKFKGHRVVYRTASIDVLDKKAVDENMVKLFDSEFQAVKDFTLRPVGYLAMPLRSRDAYVGMSDYIDLLHTVQLAESKAKVSIAAPLTFNGYVAPGQVIYNDMFTIYPFENQLFVLKLSGRELKSMLELSYDRWICTPGDHVLRIKNTPDPRTGAEKWSFENRSYNFDSAAGINYTVDVTKPFGERIVISGFADGSAFDYEAMYTVAMTSYRANGGGDLLVKGAGIPHEELSSRVVARYPEIREMVYQFIKSHEQVDHDLVSDRTVLGEWRFVPESVALPLLKSDLELVF
ncbi:MAG: bifunctional metallophosphatase/5'-nucleotidase [Bacteroidales bacterium]|nr:bifunctional metallophosphatase/5'-nucleotidase [Bacteroidales bacterium]